jgi:hypothetical protein
LVSRLSPSTRPFLSRWKRIENGSAPILRIGLEDAAIIGEEIATLVCGMLNNVGE